MPEPTVWAEDVRPEWIDYNGHLSEPYYVLVFGHATDAVMARLRIVPQETGTSLYTVEAHVRYLAEVPPGSRLEVRSSVIGVTAKLLWIWHEMSSDGRLRATEEVVAVHVADRRAAPFPDDLRERAEALRVRPPEHASRRIALR